MGVKLKVKDDILICSFSGEFSIEASNDLKEVFQDGILKYRKIIFNLEEVSHIDAIAIGRMVSCFRQAQVKKSEVKIAGINAKIKILFDTLRGYTVFSTHNDVDEAISSFSNKN